MVADYGSGVSSYPDFGAGPGEQLMWLFRVLAMTNSLLPKTSPGQIAAPGDSGGPNFIFQNGIPLITGILSGMTPVCTDPTSDVTCKNTLTGIISAFAISIPAVHDRIQAVLASQWHPILSPNSCCIGW